MFEFFGFSKTQKDDKIHPVIDMQFTGDVLTLVPNPKRPHAKERIFSHLESGQKLGHEERARKNPLLLRVHFGEEPGAFQFREGPDGSVIVTGNINEAMEGLILNGFFDQSKIWPDAVQTLIDTVQKDIQDFQEKTLKVYEV